MKICWDNLEKLRYNNKKQGWYKINRGGKYTIKENCGYNDLKCKEE